MDAKKILTCAALFAGLLLATPARAYVESDVVGYATIDIGQTGYTLITLPFADLDAENLEYPISKISGSLAANNSASRADTLVVMNADKSFTTYQNKADGWVKEGETEVTTDTVKPGQAVYLNKARQAGSVTVSGKVAPEATKTVALAVGYNLVANPYPVEIAIASLTGEIAANNNASRADTLMVLNADKTYTTYQCKAAGWVKEGETDVTTDTIQPGQGFVYNKSRQAGSLTFTRPF